MHQLGISSVPTFIINQKYAINGGQPADVFKQALQQIQSEAIQTA
jgi:predicted DsbA family dithiol-disulfide isomerase